MYLLSKNLIQTLFYDKGSIVGFYCTFEDGWCDGWLNGELFGDSNVDSFLVNNGKTSTPGTGPDKDHTVGTIDGRYIYLEGSDTTRFGRTAAIRSPKINFGAAESYCLIFWHSMFGDDVGSLSVSIEFTLFNFELNLLTLTGEQVKSGEWKQEMIDIVKKVLIDFRLYNINYILIC